MSYLLKALKKAEEERQSLSSEDGGTTAVVVQKQAALPIWLVFVVIALLSMTVWKLFINDPNTKPDYQALVAAPTQVNPSPSPKDSVSNVESQLSNTKTNNTPETYQLGEGEVLVTPQGFIPDQDASAMQSQLDQQVKINKSLPAKDVKPAKQIKQLAELSKSQLSQIPSLALESHLFSSVAKYSSVVINGGTYAEGDYINSDIIIEKINAEGILISLGDLLVELPKGITWVSN